MKTPETKTSNFRRPASPAACLAFAIFSLGGMVLTFVFATSLPIFSTKVFVFAAIVVGYSLGSFGFYLRYLRRLDESSDPDHNVSDGHVFDKEVEETLEVLDEAGTFFSASLKSDDMFRLLTSRIREIIPHHTAVLYIADEKNRLKALHSSGENSRQMTAIYLECDQGIAGKSYISGEVELDRDLSIDRKFIDKKILKDYSAALAVPLCRSAETYGVIVLYGDEFTERDETLIAAIGERASPLLTSSFSFEESISNLMVDSLTNLPNERAFYLVLENQLAEAQRFQEQRPLTILTIDIKDFADFNRAYGHSTGDNLLAFASEIIAGELRQMDFLCRSMSDEFWVVLPTASDEVTKKVITRIELAVASNFFELSENRKYNAQLNFGSATFLRDGETTNHLLQKALLRKKQSKEGSESSVIMFPKEYVN